MACFCGELPYGQRSIFHWHHWQVCGSALNSLDHEDVSLVFTENGFHRLMLIEQPWENEPFPLQLPSPDWNHIAPLLRVPAVDLDDI